MSAFKLLAIETSSSTGSIALGVQGEIIERTIATPREQTPRILAIIDELLVEAGLKLRDLDALVFGRGPGSFTGLRVAAAVVQGLSLAAGGRLAAGTSIAAGKRFADAMPIVSVSSLAALAERAFSEVEQTFSEVEQTFSEAEQTFSEAEQTFSERVAPKPPPGLEPEIECALCCVDARMSEVYWASFQRIDGRIVAHSEERIGSPDAVAAPDLPFIAVGDGFASYSAVLAAVTERAEAVQTSIVPGARELLTLAEADVLAERFLPVEAALPVYLRESDAWRKA